MRTDEQRLEALDRVGRSAADVLDMLRNLLGRVVALEDVAHTPLELPVGELLRDLVERVTEVERVAHDPVDVTELLRDLQRRIAQVEASPAGRSPADVARIAELEAQLEAMCGLTAVLDEDGISLVLGAQCGWCGENAPRYTHERDDLCDLCGVCDVVRNEGRGRLVRNRTGRPPGVPNRKPTEG